MSEFISVIIPNRNSAFSIEKCLKSVFASKYEAYEVIVVDDCSDDDSVERISRFPCRLIQLSVHMGAAAARNVGARASKGTVLFFTDADCILQEDTLCQVAKALASDGERKIIGGTYTAKPYDSGFFSRFQSAFVHYSETKKAQEPDYVATHAMVITADQFAKSGGFREDFLPILEDVEFSHRLRRTGAHLRIAPEIEVRHFFNYSFFGSWGNAFKKAKYWIQYSLQNRDLFADSGTASSELKINLLFFAVSLLSLFASALSSTLLPLIGVVIFLCINMICNRGLFRVFYICGNPFFTIKAVMYYLFIYPIPVWAGALSGLVQFMIDRLFPLRSSSKKYRVSEPKPRIEMM